MTRRRTLTIDLHHLEYLGPYPGQLVRRLALLQRLQLADEHPLERVEDVELVLPAHETDRRLPRCCCARALNDGVELVRLRNE